MMDCPFFYFPRVGSTLDVAKDGFPDLKQDAAVYYTFCQDAGRGQAGNSWFGGENRNMAVTICIKPDTFPIQDLYGLNLVFSLGMLEYARTQARESILKWPNDVYLTGSKLAGVLVESRWSGCWVQEFYFGAGFNVNQEVFPSDIPHPISFFNHDGYLRNLEEQVRLLSFSVLDFYGRFLSDCQSRDRKTVLDGYREVYVRNLLYYQVERVYRYKGIPVQARIVDVSPEGRLIMEVQQTGHLPLSDPSLLDNGKYLEADVKEVSFW